MERKYEEYLAALSREFPGFQLRVKDDCLIQRLIHYALVAVTFGQQRYYLSHYVTTMRKTVYVPSDWEHWPALERLIVMRHERVHLAQFRRYTLIGMAILYLFPILPIGLAIGRARLEWEAYAETIQATFELRGEEQAAALRDEIIRRFVGPDYGWMWPFAGQVGRWFDRELDLARLRASR